MNKITIKCNYNDKLKTYSSELGLHDSLKQGIMEVTEHLASLGGGMIEIADVINTDRIESKQYLANKTHEVYKDNRKIRGEIPKDIAELVIVGVHHVKRNSSLQSENNML